VRRFWAKRPESTLRPRLLEKLYPYVFSQGDGRAKRYLQNFFKKSLDDVASPVFSHLVRWQNTAQLRSFLNPDIQAAGSLEGFIQRYVRTLPSDYMAWKPLSRAQYTEMKLFLSNYLLSSQGDRMAMANSVEGRYPFLDHRVVEFAGRVPTRWRLNGLTEKYILKQASHGSVPDEIIDRPKQPYRAPISRCFFRPDAPEYVGEMLSESAIRKAGLFDADKVGRLAGICEFERFPSGGAFICSRKCQTLVSHPAKPGVYLTANRQYG
jgi:asparagine synthase (glutamine-hydrolysing)